MFPKGSACQSARMKISVRHAILAAALAAVVFVPACTAPQARTTSVTLPVSWRNAAGFPTASPQGDLSRWWSQFGDARLTSIIGEALAGNKDIASAM